jgi:hypothetical protein
LYCEAYDIVIEPDTLTHIALILFVAFGLGGYFFCFPLLLFDVMNMSVILSNVLRAIYRPLRSLLLTLWLFIIILFVYTSIGMYYFNDQYVSGDDDGAVNPCPDLLRCFIQTIFMGLTDPATQGMDGVTYKDGTGWVSRIIFDLSFFIILGVLLFDMVTGIIVDTFGELRGEAESRKETQENKCFVCGIERSKMDDMGTEFNFDDHVQSEHEVWNYLYFYAYLTRKPDTELNGPESDILAQIEDKDTSWFPSRTSWRIQENARNEMNGIDSA